jgi:hypothetical protein
MAPASIVFPDPLFFSQTPVENDEQRFHCNRIRQCGNQKEVFECETEKETPTRKMRDQDGNNRLGKMSSCTWKEKYGREQRREAPKRQG